MLVVRTDAAYKRCRRLRRRIAPELNARTRVMVGLPAHDVLTDAHIELHALLWAHVRQNARAWPAQDNLADQLGVSQPTISRQIADLAEGGWLYKEKRRWGPMRGWMHNVYKMTVPPVVPSTPAVRDALAARARARARIREYRRQHNPFQTWRVPDFVAFDQQERRVFSISIHQVEVGFHDSRPPPAIPRQSGTARRDQTRRELDPERLRAIKGAVARLAASQRGWLQGGAVEVDVCVAYAATLA
jgi:DNA-binding transcriptional MocR family regulator